jgi:hypothetical protein
MERLEIQDYTFEYKQPEVLLNNAVCWINKNRRNIQRLT